MFCPIDTVNTTRIPTSNSTVASVYVSRLLWPTEHSPKHPKVLILASCEYFPYSYMAASLVHDPIQGNLLLIPPDRLPAITAEEIMRLDPKGSSGLPPIVMVGPFYEEVIKQVECLGYDVLQVYEHDIFKSANSIARLRKEIVPKSPDGPKSLFIISSENPYEAMPVPYYSTHSGVPVLFTETNKLPRATAELLYELSDNIVYIIGSTRSVAEKVEKEIESVVLNPVRRIAGRNTFETAVCFAAYHDPETKLGWNRNKRGRGDAFTYGNIRRWDLALAGSALAHHGKHTPFLPTCGDYLPQEIANYLEYLRPPHRTPPMPPFMHGFILGLEDEIDVCTQTEINNITDMAMADTE